MRKDALHLVRGMLRVRFKRLKRRLRVFSRGVLWRIGRILAPFILKALRSLPRDTLHAIGTGFGSAWFHLIASSRGLGLDNLDRVFGKSVPRGQKEYFCRESFKNILKCMLDFYYFSFHPEEIESHILADPEAEEKVRAILDKGRGVLVFSAHLGNWELMPYISAALGIPMAVVVRPLDNPHIERLLYQSRRDTGQLFPPKKNSMLPLQHLLRQGKSLGLLPDQSTIKGIPAPFFGRPALTTPVPALLAMRNERPLVVVACCWRDDGRFIGYVSDPILPAPDAGEKAEVLRLTAAMNREMETLIRRHPEQYFWMHRRWKTYD